MNDASRSTQQSPFPGDHSGTAGLLPTVVRTILYAALICAIGTAGYATFRATQEQAASRDSQDRLVAYHGLMQATGKRLAPPYKDKDGNLLADAPSDPQKLLDPETLVLAHYKDADADTQLVDWDALQAHLAQATGKKVVTQEYLNSADDVAAIKAKAIHVIALHAADAPYVVNNAGFVPFAVLGTEAGAHHGNHLDVAVGPSSEIKTLADLRGHTLTCTAPDSITGYRAAIAVLAEETGMRPDVDYFINFSHGQKRSVLGLAGGDFEVAALSDDKVQSLLKQGSIDKSDYRVIYESEVIPRLTIGYICDLMPALAEQIAAATIDFANNGGADEESTGHPMQFFASDYKQDFAFVRKIDDSFDPRFHKRPVMIPVPEAHPDSATPAETAAPADSSTPAETPTEVPIVE
jgi:phosphonate transport system substrate-binding protein